ncbi:DUF4442 domain-containing protein [Aureivirga sp. CE67]|uniref:DUF4442 domain-containing protein n=1 Tax=Aureivirga sp. CE67 TaxID=1788983 RepID=UPI0018C8F33B|nr:DUF4442 domain-containing protein [Aureivirga sp. CE67]
MSESALVKKYNKFLMFKVPLAYLAGVRIKTIENTKCEVGVKFKWLNQNPFNSIYFAVLSMAAELTTGVLVLKKTQETKKSISTLVVSHQGDFLKKAKGRITFICEDEEKIEEAIKQMQETGEAVTVKISSCGYNEENQMVASYTFLWSLKMR